MVGLEETCPAPLCSGRPLIGQSRKEEEEEAWCHWTCHLEILPPGIQQRLVNPRVQMWVQDPPVLEPSHVPRLDRRLGPCLLSQHWTQHRWSAALVQAWTFASPKDMHSSLWGCLPGTFLGPLFAGSVPLPPNLQASTSNFRINVFVYIHTA